MYQNDGVQMYTGEMIEELVRFVQRAEQNAQLERPITLRKAVLNAAGYTTYIYEGPQPQSMEVAQWQR